MQQKDNASPYEPEGNDMRHEKTVSVSKIRPLWEPWKENETPRKCILCYLMTCSFSISSLKNVQFYVKRDVRIIWQYGLWSFQMGDKKLERFLPKN